MIRLAVRVASERAEEALAELLELAPAGVEEIDLGEQVEYAVYGAPGELPELPDLQALAGGAPVHISTSEIADDWQERWKAFHHPVLVSVPTHAGARTSERPAVAFHVRPPWEQPARRQGVREIVIDPGQAFGTGAHATTRMCLELLMCIAAAPGSSAPMRLLDLGTGSGVLAIAGAMLGFEPVLGLDNERESVSAARENALVNGVEMEVRHFDLRSDSLPWIAEEPAGVPLLLSANLLRPLLLELAAALPRPPAHLVAGGLLADEADEIAAAFAAGPRMRERLRLHSGEWAALWLSAH